MKAMIFAAGLGTRLKPFTDQHPKALALVNGISLLERNIRYLRKSGIHDLVINVHHFPEQIFSFLKENKNFGCNIQISDESYALLETGGGLKKAASLLSGKDPVLVINVDILTDLDISDMLNFHRSNQALATLAVTGRNTSRYFLFNIENRLCGWKNVITSEEKIPVPDSLLVPKAFSGIHIIQPEIFDMMKQHGKFSIVDVYLDLCPSHKIIGYDHSGGLLIDVGKPEAIAQAAKLFK